MFWIFFVITVKIKVFTLQIKSDQKNLTYFDNLWKFWRKTIYSFCSTKSVNLLWLFLPYKLQSSTCICRKVYWEWEGVLIRVIIKSSAMKDRHVHCLTWWDIILNMDVVAQIQDSGVTYIIRLVYLSVRLFALQSPR